MLIGDYDAANTESPLGPLKDQTESVSVTPVKGFKRLLISHGMKGIKSRLFLIAGLSEHNFY